MATLLQAGLKCSLSLPIARELTVPALAGALRGFADMPAVFATAYMVGLIEWAAIEALRPQLPAGAITVGSHVDVSHCAASPIGLTARADVDLLSVEGRRLRFRVVCRDDFETIGEGFHERHVVDLNAFVSRVEAKRHRHAAASGRQT